MYEEAFVDHQHDVVLRQSHGEGTTGKEGGGPCPVAPWKSGRRSRARIGVLERDEPTPCDIAKVTGDVHHLMVAVEHVNPTASLAGLLRQAIQQVQNRSLTVTTIEHITSLHQDGLTAAPRACFIQDPSKPKDALGSFEVAVQIPDRHNPPRCSVTVRCIRLDRLGGGRRCDDRLGLGPWLRRTFARNPPQQARSKHR